MEKTVEQMTSELKSHIESAVADKVTKQELTELQKNFNELVEKAGNTETIEIMKKQIEQLTEIVTKGANKGTETKAKTIHEQIEKALEVEKKDSPIGYLTPGKKLSVKAVHTTSNVITDSTLTARLQNVAMSPQARFALTDLFPVQMITDPNSMEELAYIDWDEASTVRAAAARAEGAAVPTSDMAMREYSITMQSVADSLDLTKAAQRSSRIFASQVEPFLARNMKSKENSYLYSGNGTTEPMGIYTRVPLFNYAGYTGQKTANANIADLALVIKRDIMKGADQDYFPDFVLMDWDSFIDLEPYEKDANGNYIVKPRHGFLFIPSTYVTANTMVVGDSQFAKIYKTLMYDMEWGYKSGNFEKRVPSLIVETVMNLLIREVDKAAFRKVDDVAAALTAITTP